MVNFNTWRSIVDGSEYGDIPDAENLHANYDLQQQPESDGQTIDPLVDQSGNGYDLGAVGGPTMDIDGFNGYPTAVLDNVDDGWEVNTWDTLTQPYTFYAVFAIDGSTSQSQKLYTNSNTDPRSLTEWNKSGFFRLYSGSLLDASGSSSGTNDIAVIHNGDSSLIEEEGTQTGSGNAGTDDLDDLHVGYRPSQNDQYFDGRMCELLYYDANHDSSTRSDVRSYLVNRWSL